MSTEARQKKTNANQRKRAVAAELNSVLAAKRCTNCGTVGAWKVYARGRGRGRIRYIKCMGCAHCDKIPVMVDMAEKPVAGPEGMPLA